MDQVCFELFYPLIQSHSQNAFPVGAIVGVAHEVVENVTLMMLSNTDVTSLYCTRVVVTVTARLVCAVL